MIAAIFGLVGYWLVKHDFEPAPLVLAFVLGPLMEENLRRAMLVAGGDPIVFATRPISAGLLLVALFLLDLAMLPMIGKRPNEVFAESENQKLDPPKIEQGRHVAGLVCLFSELSTPKRSI